MTSHLRCTSQEQTCMCDWDSVLEPSWSLLLLSLVEVAVISWPAAAFTCTRMGWAMLLLGLWGWHEFHMYTTWHSSETNRGEKRVRWKLESRVSSGATNPRMLLRELLRRCWQRVDGERGGMVTCWEPLMMEGGRRREWSPVRIRKASWVTSTGWDKIRNTCTNRKVSYEGRPSPHTHTCESKNKAVLLLIWGVSSSSRAETGMSNRE